MAETRKLAAILVSDVVGYIQLAAADEDRTLARLRAPRSDLIDPTIAVHNRRLVKVTAKVGLNSRVWAKDWGGSFCRVECRDRSPTFPFSRPLASGLPHRRCSLGAY